MGPDEAEKESENENLRSDSRGTVQYSRTEDARERGGVTPTSHSRKTRRLCETVASCGEPEPRDGKRRTGPGRAEEGRRSISEKPQNSLCDVENGRYFGW